MPCSCSVQDNVPLSLSLSHHFFYLHPSICLSLLNAHYTYFICISLSLPPLHISFSYSKFETIDNKHLYKGKKQDIQKYCCFCNAEEIRELQYISGNLTALQRYLFLCSDLNSSLPSIQYVNK